MSGNNSIININVNANNTLFSSVDGVLYDYSGETLIRYPRARTNQTYTLNDNTRVLANTSFMNCLSLTTINFNENLIAIGTNVFTGSTSLRSMNFTSVNPPYLMGFNSFPTNYNLDNDLKYKKNEKLENISGELNNKYNTLVKKTLTVFNQ